MNCEQCQQLLLDYTYGELPAAQQADFLAALERCPECKQELARLQRVRRSVQEAAPAREVPALLHANVMRQARLHADQLQTQRQGIWEKVSSLLFHPAFASATALVALFAVGVSFFDLGQGEPAMETAAQRPPALAQAPAASPTMATPAAAEKADEEELAQVAEGKDLDKPSEAAPMGGAPGGSLDGQAMALRDEAKAPAQEPSWARNGNAGRVQERAPEPTKGTAGDDGALGNREFDGLLEEQEKAKATPPTEAPLAKSDAPKDDAMNAGASRAARGSGAATNGDGLAVAGAGTNMLEGRSGFGGSQAQGTPQDNDAYGDAYTTKQSASSGVWSENNDPALGPQAQPADALPAAAEQRYTSGMSRYNRGDFAGAVEDFNAFIREAPRSSDYYALALYHRGRSEMNQGNPRAAASSFRKVLQEFPNSGKQPEARYWLAKSLLQLNPQDEEGLAILDELSQGNSSVAADARRDSQAYGRRDAERRAKPSKDSNAPTKKAKSYDQKDELYEPAEQQQQQTVE